MMPVVVTFNHYLVFFIPIFCINDHHMGFYYVFQSCPNKHPCLPYSNFLSSKCSLIILLFEGEAFGK